MHKCEYYLAMSIFIVSLLIAFAFGYGVREIIVESRRGAVLEPLAQSRFPSPLIKPDVRISRIRLSDWLHRKAHGDDRPRSRRRHRTANSP